MKRQTILLLLSVLLLSGGAAAQSTKEQTLEDLNRTAALYYCYENHPARRRPRPKATNPSTSATTAATVRVGTPRRASTKIRAQSSARRPKQVNSRRWAKMPCAASRSSPTTPATATATSRRAACAEHRGIAERMYCSFPKSFSTADGRLCRIRAVRRSCRAACSAWPPQTNGSKS